MTPVKLNRKSVAGALAAVLGVAAFVAASFIGGTAQSSADTTLDTEEQAFVTQLNLYRTQNGLVPLLIDPSLQQAAEWMNIDMGTYNYFSHTDHLGQSPWTRMCNFGYCYNTYKAENIAAGYSTGAAVFTGWRNSSGHNANMLGVNYRVMGLARNFVAGSTYGWYWTNDFGGYITSNSYPPQGPTNTPAPTNSPTPTPSPTTSPTKTPSPTPTNSPSPTPTPTSTPSPTPTASPTKTASPTPTPPPTVSPTPAATATPSACQSDFDCDGFGDIEELFMGTNPFASCAQTTTPNDEPLDPNPSDTNDDGTFNTLDTVSYLGHLNSLIGSAAYEERLDVNANGVVNTLDLIPLALRFNTTCR